MSTVKRTKIDELYENDFWEEDTQATAPDDIFTFTEIRSCADIYRMYKSGILDLQPDFQRDIVWGKADRTRFVDSIIKGFPIPSLCFSYDSKLQKWLVIDGLQRISTIVDFLDKSDEKYSKLEDIEQRIAGKSAYMINNDESCNDIVTRIENCSLPLTVLRCDYSKKDHLAFLFTVFHRLNSTGVKLNNQEIRNCIYAGPFNAMLRELDSYQEWQKLNKNKKGSTDRMRGQELILRFFAFQDRLEMYDGKLVSFLNDYMNDNKNVNLDTIDEYKKIFMTSVEALNRLVQKGLISKDRLSLVVQDTLLYGIGKNNVSFYNKSLEEQATMINKALQDEIFSEEQLSGGIMQKAKLINRMRKIEEALR